MRSRLRSPERITALAVVALLVLGLGLRAWFLASPLGEADADEAVVGLMASDMLDGDFEAFFWGQEYGGVHEAVFVAALLGAGVPRLAALKLVPLLLFAVGAVLVWRIGRRLLDGPAGERAGRLAGALFFAAPAGVVWMSTKERGFYASSLVLGLAVVLLVLRLDERWDRRDAALLGLAAGAAFYAGPQSAYLLIPAGGWLAVRTWKADEWRGVVRALPWGMAGLVVGALPWLVANLSTGWASLEVPGGLPDTSYLDRLELFFRRGVPLALGLRNPAAEPWIMGTAGTVAYGLVVAGAVALVAWKRPRPGRGWLIVAGVALYPFVFAVFPTSFTLNDVRYVTMLVPFLALVAGWAVARSGAPVVIATVVALVALSVVGTAEAIDEGDTLGRWDVSPGDLDPLVAALDAHGVDRAFADYWIAHRLAFATDEEVIASPLEVVRNHPYERAVRREAQPAYVLFRGTQQEQWLGGHLGRHRIGFERFDAGIYVVYVPAERVLPEDVAEVWAEAPGRAEARGIAGQ